MGILIRTLQDATPNPRKYANPVQRGLAYSFLGNVATPERNFALRQRDGVVVGTPTQADDYSWRFQGFTNFIQTEMPDVMAQTFLIVCKTPDTLVGNANIPGYFGTFGGRPLLQDTDTLTFGTRLYHSVPTTIRFGQGRGTSVSDHLQATTSVFNTAASYGLYVCETHGNNRITNATSGITTADSNTSPPFPTRQTLRLGSVYETLGGVCDIANFRAWTVHLTTDEIAAEVADMRAYMARQGITV